MLEQFQLYIDQKQLCTPQHRVLLAVSGGLDSMAMIHLFQAAGYPVAVAHCNFQLRGRESNSDESFVKRQCGQLKIPFFSKRFDTNNYAIANKRSLQMAARELRYKWFSELMVHHRFDFLATAHHLNDSLETILLNWVNGAGVEALAGIRLKRGNIIRPLLFATKAQLVAFSIDQRIVWREDSSNLTDDYQRNFIRHQVVPKLKEINPSLEHTLSHSSEKILGELQFFQSAVQEWKEKHVRPYQDGIQIKKKSLADGSAAILWHCLRERGFNFEICQDVIRALNGQSGKQFLSDSFKLVIDRDAVLVTPHQTAWQKTSIKKDQRKAALGPWSLVHHMDDAKPVDNPDIAVLDESLLTFPLIWRKWKAGDYFYPLGMNHRKKISDFLIDKKLSVVQKDLVTVLESGGKIAWVVGHRIDDRFKLTPATKAARVFTVQIELAG